jgi:hypothetical protein
MYFWPQLPRAPWLVRRPVPERPAGDWAEVDTALLAACAASPLRTCVLLVSHSAEESACSYYALYETTGDDFHAVIAIGYRDRSVSCCVLNTLVARNKTTVQAIFDQATQELLRGSLAGALLVVARHVPMFVR